MSVERKTTIDEMVEYALEELLSGSEDRRRAMVRNMCQRWRNTPALSVVFALTSAASLIEDNFDRQRDASRLSPFAFRLAAILAADIYAIERMDQRPATAHDLLHFWRRVDRYFLDL